MEPKRLNNKRTQLRKFAIRSFDLILFGNLYVALGAVCLTQSTVIQLGLAGPYPPYSVLIFFSTLFIYNLQRLFYIPQKDNSLHSVRRKWIFENQVTIRMLCCISFLGVCISFFYLDSRVIIYLSPLLLISIAYFIPFIKLRKSAWFKLLTLVLVWTLATAVVPLLLNHSEIFTKNSLLHILVRFCFMMAICIPFDIRDLQIDKADTISTLPHLLGENKTRWLAALFMIIYCLLILLEYVWQIINIKIVIALLISALINGVLVFMSNSKRSEYFYVAMIDGTMILQGLLLLFVRYVNF